jgi:Flp pilus assembly protein TadD
VAIGAGLALLVAVVYWQVHGFDFVNFDDPEYVSRNRWVLQGLTWDGIAWAFTGFRVSNWHPLTWLSHMLDVQLFGPTPGAHHVVSAVLHSLNTVLLFALLRGATGATWRSAVVAALFGLHPLHVESVAWVSERKDLLSTLFLLLTLQAWVGFARGRGVSRYVAALACFALGLMSKPMLVTTPFLLLLLDAWPLGRMPVGEGRPFVRNLGRLAVEKTPFFLLAAAASTVTWLAQSAGGGGSAVSPIAFWPRAANALVSYVRYLVLTAWPEGLASFYPHPATVGPVTPLLPALGAASLLALVTAWVVRERTVRPYLAWGWFWYVGTLVPVIGFLQVGGQAMADRYTYVPLIGIFVAAVWGFSDVAGARRVPRPLLPLVAGAVVAVHGALAWRQAGFWKDSVTLHRRSLDVTASNWKASQGLCDALLDLGRFGEATAACEQAIRILPVYPEAWQTLGVVRARMGKPEEAIPLFRKALALRPDYFNALRNLGSAVGNLGDYRQASGYFQEALRLRSDDAETWGYLGVALLRAGDRDGATMAYRRLQALDPVGAEALRRKLDP